MLEEFFLRMEFFLKTTLFHTKTFGCFGLIWIFLFLLYIMYLLDIKKLQ